MTKTKIAVGFMGIILIAVWVGLSVKWDRDREAQLCASRVISCPGEADYLLPIERATAHPDAIYGVASFYDYTLDSGWSSVGHRVAAMRDVPRGSMVRVTDLSTGKSVDVKVTDFGPDESLHPDRVIDLSSYAFSKLKDTKYGLIQDVRVEILE